VENFNRMLTEATPPIMDETTDEKDEWDICPSENPAGAKRL
jgi:hypothetical protein